MKAIVGEITVKDTTAIIKETDFAPQKRSLSTIVIEKPSKLSPPSITLTPIVEKAKKEERKVTKKEKIVVTNKGNEKIASKFQFCTLEENNNPNFQISRFGGLPDEVILIQKIISTNFIPQI